MVRSYLDEHEILHLFRVVRVLAGAGQDALTAGDTRLALDVIKRIEKRLAQLRHELQPRAQMRTTR